MTEVLIAGGGLSGAAMAVLLARAGCPVQLLERSVGPVPKICGEFLSIEAQEHLAALGVGLDVLGAVRVSRLRLAWGQSIVEADLPFVARGLSRMVLDEVLLDLATGSGAAVERGVRVTGIASGRLRTSAGERGARTLVLATGKHDVREDGTAAKSPPRDAHVGFKMHWRLPPTQRQRLAGVIELTLFSGGYAGVQMVGEDVANLCLALRRDRLAELGGRWEDVLAMLSARSPDLRRLVDAEPLFARPVTIANLSYGRLHGVGGPDHAYRLGDQAAMTASLTGDGMAIALRSAWLAAHCLLEGEGPAVYHARLRAMVGTQMRRGMFIQRLAERRAPRPFAMGAMRLWPGVLRAMVGLTRLPMLSQI